MTFVNDIKKKKIIITESPIPSLRPIRLAIVPITALFSFIKTDHSNIARGGSVHYSDRIGI